MIFFLRNREKTQLESLMEELKISVKKTEKTDEMNLTKEDKRLIERIRGETSDLNQNNVTRTKAYLDFYHRHPEVHWAFLGHMVSRNGGWNMTDLKGEFLPRLLSKKERYAYFTFLERANWLIFQDAYPQFSLYSESIKRKKPLFYLLPYLNVSIFMETVWSHFWKNADTYILTMALVINEQNYLEKRVIQNPLYQKEVLNTLEFTLQDFLSFNHILFPYADGRKVKLLGQTLHQFSSLKERIYLGKRLYAILFQNNELVKQTVDWAERHPHTGSRKDYWPNIFNTINEGLPGYAYQRRLKSCKLKKGARRIYSPTLTSAWKNVKQTEAEKGDWFTDWHVADYLAKENEIINGVIENEYCKTLERFELAVLAKKVISILD